MNPPALRIVLLPRVFASRGDVSMADLLREAGYFDSPHAVTEAVLRDALQANAASVDDWFLWSENKRTTSGWFLRRVGPTTHEVASIPARDDLRREFSDPLDACAAFIKREAEAIRMDAARPAHSAPVTGRMTGMLQLPDERGVNAIPFTASEIAEIVVTHDRWNFERKR